MTALRFLHVFALTVWIGGMITLGAVAAPTIFQVIQARVPQEGRLVAGAVFGEALHRFHPIAYVAGVVAVITLVAMALLGPRPVSFWIRTAIATAMLVLSLVSGLWLLPAVDRLQADIGGLASELPVSDARRARFDRLHRLSTSLMSVNIAGGLLLLYWVAKD